ncbi:MAG: AbrB family transcriptional regulator [Alicyclobacillaceae bacterium]|nr:AbrB family transcriptional regulator [Alicyclobacillaceae bacterium]
MGTTPLYRVHRKITKIGNSLGITFTKEALQSLDLNAGDEVEVTVNGEKGEIVIRKAAGLPPGIDPRFFEVLIENVERYRETIEGLKDR